MAKTTLLQDPRYLPFVERYHGDPLRFAIEVCGVVPSADQISLFNAIAPMTAKVSVVSGTTTGKTYAFGVIAMWHLLCFPFNIRDDGGPPKVGSNTYIGAPRVRQVCDGVWKELNDCRVGILNSPHAWIADYYHLGKEQVYVKGFDSQWFIAQLALQQGQSVGIAGKHRFWQMCIIDEAAGVSDDHFNVVVGTQSEGGNRTLLASQGVSNAGYFYDTHHRLSRKQGGSWDALTFSTEDSPFVDDKWLADRVMECGGRNSVEYQVRFLGLFAEDTSNVLLSRAEIEAMLKPRSIIGEDEPFGIVVLSDVGMGEYRDDSVATVAKIIGYGDHDDDARRVEFVEIPICTNTKDEINFAGDLVGLVGRLSNATLCVDNGGIGATVNKLIERSGVPVNRIDWGKPCFKKEYKERFYNQRACGNVRLRDAIRQGRVSFPNGVSPELRSKILDQGSRLPYHYVEAGGLKYVMMKKEDMRNEGIKSPDIWDTFAFAFLEETSYVPAESYRPEGQGDRIAEAESRAAAALASI